jgi:hypothetical protein
MVLLWDDVFYLARKSGAKYPELVAAQWALESGYGSTVSGKNNYFGIKGPGTKHKTKEYLNGKWVSMVEEFKDFETPEQCIQYLVDRWYKDFKGFKGVNNSPNKFEAARGLVYHGYATDPSYAEKLIKIMTENPSPSPAPGMTHFDSKKFVDFFTHFDAANPKHVAAAEDLHSQINKVKPDLLTDEANWVRIYRTDPNPSGVLNVPYYSQRDNYRDASRTCFSSSCAMLCKFLKPNSIKGDDDYIREIFKRGDTTDAAIQVQTLKHFGVNARFATNLTFSTLDSLLSQGIPVPIGILHHGPSSAPSGGGHWIIVIGKEGDGYIVNDPWGELDNASGTYSSTNGAKLKYSKKMLGQRWTVEGDGSGWAIIASK